MTHDHTFKTYIANGREYYEYSVDALTWLERSELERHGQPTLIKKDFPFPESLLSLLYFDTRELEPLVKRIDKAIREFLPSKDEQYVHEGLAALDELAQIHVYFELVRLEWRWRFAELKANGNENRSEWLPRKRITHIPANIEVVQRQIIDLFSHALDMDGEKKPLPERITKYYHWFKENYRFEAPTEPFQFECQSLSFEAVDDKTFTDVLYPDSIYSIIDFHLRECVKREARLRVCKNCGRYFAIQGRSNAEYCDRIFDEKGRTCKNVGAIALWTKNKSSDEAFKLCRREYKKRFAWIKAGKILPEEVYAWGEKAREKKAECEEGKISLEEFEAWLKQS